MDTLHHILYTSPVGELRLIARGDRLLMCDWTSSSHHLSNLARLGLNEADLPSSSPSGILSDAIQWLDSYISHGLLPAMPPLDPMGTPFQRSVWQALLSLRRGQTVSYTDLAALSGHPEAVRAVASAIASNPISIFIPCHLVTRADGSTGQYAGGTTAKRRLIAHEQSPTP